MKTARSMWPSHYTNMYAHFLGLIIERCAACVPWRVGNFPLYAYVVHMSLCLLSFCLLLLLFAAAPGAIGISSLSCAQIKMRHRETNSVEGIFSCLKIMETVWIWLRLVSILAHFQCASVRSCIQFTSVHHIICDLIYQWTCFFCCFPIHTHTHM